MFRIEMLRAGHGDSLWVEWGDAEQPYCLLIDGGPRLKATGERLRELLRTRLGDGTVQRRPLELLVVSHIDFDHITGILGLLEDRALPLAARDVWFNGWDHLPSDLMGAKQGELLGQAIVRRKLSWNGDFGGHAVQVPDAGELPSDTLSGGLRWTLLSPTRVELAALRPVWKREVEKAGLVPGAPAEEPEAQPDALGEEALDPEALGEEPFEPDTSEANGSSIALLLEYEGKSVLLSADAFAPLLEHNLRRLAAERGCERLPLAALKLSHHGSRHNVSPGLLRAVQCERFLVSTNGSYFQHPDPVALSRVVVGREGGELVFNYETEFTRPWDARRLKRRFRYRTRYAGEDARGIAVAL